MYKMGRYVTIVGFSGIAMIKKSLVYRIPTREIFNKIYLGFRFMGNSEYLFSQVFRTTPVGLVMGGIHIGRVIRFVSNPALTRT